jgi:copper resistance protein B
MSFRLLQPVLAIALALGPSVVSPGEPAGVLAEGPALVQGHTGHPPGQVKAAPPARQTDPPPKPQEPGQDPHAGHGLPADAPREPIPPVTDADRQAAFPDVRGHSVHDRAIHYFVLFDKLEWQPGDGHTGASWDNTGWVGGDIDRFWFRTEGEAEGGSVDDAQVHALYGRAIGRWWDVVAGIRQDVRPGSPRTWAAVGIQGLAPYWFEIEATAYVAAGGRTHARLETEYELLLTNRLILQPLLEVDIYGKSDPERRIGAGLSRMQAEARLRFEIRREFAPYVGVAWFRRFFGTADLARERGEDVSGARLALGARVWF